MPKKREPSFTIPSVDELFVTPEKLEEERLTRIRMIPVSQIDPFPEHPFQVKDDEDMMQLVESIKERGVIVPVAVRQKEDGRYELVSGHRRTHACELAGIELIPAEIKELTRDEAIVMMVESNLQRSRILPSEKAKAYKMRLEAMKRQGARTDLTSDPVGQKLVGETSREKIAQKIGDSSTQVQRYIRLTELVPDALSLVDEGKIALRPAVELSYIGKDRQEQILECCDINQCTPSHAQTIRLRKLDEAGDLSWDKIVEIMSEEKPNQKEKIVLRDDRIRKLLPQNLSKEKTEEYVVKALEHYAKFQERKRKEQDRER